MERKRLYKIIIQNIYKIKIFLIFLLFSSKLFASECVVLLHGLGRSSYSLTRIEAHLQEKGYSTFSIDYPSRSYPIPYLVEHYLSPVVKKNIDYCNKIHFLGYSMGGIMIRYFLQFEKPSNLGKVVFLASPNKGSQIVNTLGEYSLFTKIFGKNVEDLAYNSKFIKSLPQKIDFEAGVIAGTLSYNPLTSIFMLPGENDGTVSLESTKIEGIKDFISFLSTHSTILYNQNAIEQISYFFKNGEFKK